MTKENYVVNVYCTNCNWHGTRNISKGVSVEILDTKECPICNMRFVLKSLGVPKDILLTNESY